MNKPQPLTVSGAVIALLLALGTPAPVRAEVSCRAALQAAEAGEDLPPGLMLAAARARRFGAGEPTAGLSPWTLALRDGDVVDVFVLDGPDQVLATAGAKLERPSAEPRLGCALLLWPGHAKHLKDPRAALDPEGSAGYFARYLKRLKRRLGSWTAAIGASYSDHDWKQAIHACEVAHQYARVLGRPAPSCELR